MKTGDKVICIDFAPNYKSGIYPPVLPNVPYVIGDVMKTHDGRMGINLIGVTNLGEHAAFNAKRFRKLDDLKLESKINQQLEPQVA